MKKKLLIIILCMNGAAIPAQELLDIPANGICQNNKSNIPEYLYQFDLDTIKNIVSTIIEVSGYEQNFQLIASNISPAIALMDSIGNRYLLYSRKHFQENPDPWYQILVLAHEIAHHLLGHQRYENFYFQETQESEADELLGFIMCKMGAPVVIVEQLDQLSTFQMPGITRERIQTILRGYYRAQASLLLSPQAFFYDNGSGDIIPGMPEFPLPPPACSASCSLDESFKNCKTLGDIDLRLGKALKFCGYFEYRYYHIPNGFVIVTRMEQIHDDGYSLQENRWNTKPVREEAFSLMDYFTSLFTSKPGYFRTFAFVIGSSSFNTPSSKSISRSEVIEWLNNGAFKLSADRARTPVTENTSIVALIYEFNVSESTQKASLSIPSRLDAHSHLWYSKILAALSKQ